MCSVPVYLILAFDEAGHLFYAHRLGQGVPDHGSNLVKAIDRRQVTDASSHRDHESLSGNGTGYHRVRSNIGIWRQHELDCQLLQACSLTQERWLLRKGMICERNERMN